MSVANMNGDVNPKIAHDAISSFNSWKRSMLRWQSVNAWWISDLDSLKKSQRE